jgi:hypothetical protein
VRIVFRQHMQESCQFLVGEIEAVIFSAVNADQTLILAAQFERQKLRGGDAARAMAAIMEKGDIVFARLPEMFGELLGQLGAGCIMILEHDNRRIADGVGQIVVNIVDVVEAAL